MPATHKQVVGGASALEHLGIEEHHKVKAAHEVGYCFLPVKVGQTELPGEGPPAVLDHTHFAWVDSEDVILTETQVSIRAVNEASGTLEKQWLAKIVLEGATQAVLHYKLSHYKLMDNAPGVKEAWQAEDEIEASKAEMEAAKAEMEAAKAELLSKLKEMNLSDTSAQLGDTHDTDGGEEEMKVNVFPKSQMVTATPCKLNMATKMYQPVTASSHGSRYFVVAMGNRGGSILKVAARIQGTTVSVRMEGSAIEGLTPALKQCGLANMHKGYASVHVDASSAIMAGKVIGAILVSLPEVEWTTPVPEVSILVGKGS
jgi:hypothetical protein